MVVLEKDETQPPTTLTVSVPDMLNAHTLLLSPATARGPTTAGRIRSLQPHMLSHSDVGLAVLGSGLGLGCPQSSFGTALGTGARTGALPWAPLSVQQMIPTPM